MADNFRDQDTHSPGVTQVQFRSTDTAGVHTPHVNVDNIVSGKIVPVTAGFTRPNDTTAYATGDVVSNSTVAPVVITFSNCVRANGGNGLVVGAELIDSANQGTKGVFELWLFDTTFTPDNDNAVFTPTDAELLTLVGVIDFAVSKVGDATVGAGGNCIYQASTINLGFACGAASRDLFAALVIRNAYTPVALETFNIRLFISQN